MLTFEKEIILDGGMGAFLTSVEVDSSPIWSGIANINSRDVVIDAHQVILKKLNENVNVGDNLSLQVAVQFCW